MEQANPTHLAAAAAAMYHPSGMATQLDVLPTGKVPPGFDPSTCRSVYVGNIHMKVTESMLADIFSNLGPLEGCKLIRKGDKASYGFVHYFDHQSAQAALLSLNGRQLFGQPIKVNWAYQGGSIMPKEDTSAHISIFVGDLGNEVNDATLYAAFSAYSSCSEAKVMWDNKTGRHKGYGFVYFRNQADAELAIQEMTGKWIGSRPVRCNWATRGASGALGQQQSQHQPQQQQQLLQQAGAQHSHVSSEGQGQNGAAASLNVVAGEGGTSKGGPGGTGPAPGVPAQSTGGPGPLGAPMEMAPQFTTVYVGNLSPEVTQVELHRQFYMLGLGTIEEVKVNRDKGFGFVRYQRNEEAAAAIQLANGRMIISGRPVRCSWGNKPTVPSSTPSAGLPPPPLSPQGLGMYGAGAYSSPVAQAEMLAYQHRLRSYMSQAVPGQPGGLGLGMGALPVGLAGVGPGAGMAQAGGMQGVGAVQGAMGHSGMGVGAMGSMQGAGLGIGPGTAGFGLASNAASAQGGYGQQMYY